MRGKPTVSFVSRIGDNKIYGKVSFSVFSGLKRTHLITSDESKFVGDGSSSLKYKQPKEKA